MLSFRCNNTTKKIVCTEKEVYNGDNENNTNVDPILWFKHIKLD